MWCFLCILCELKMYASFWWFDCCFCVPLAMCTETSLIWHSLGCEKVLDYIRNCQITEWLLANFFTVTAPYKIPGLERMLDYRSVWLLRFHWIWPHSGRLFSSTSDLPTLDLPTSCSVQCQHGCVFVFPWRQIKSCKMHLRKQSKICLLCM